MQSKGIDLLFDSFDGITPGNPGNLLSLLASLEDHVLNHPVTQKLQAQVRSLSIFPNRPQVSIIHQYQIASPNFRLGLNELSKIEFGRKIQRITIVYSFILKQFHTSQISIVLRPQAILSDRI